MPLSHRNRVGLLNRNGAAVSSANHRGARRWALAALSGVLLTSVYPPFSLSMVGWVALAPLIMALDGTTARRGFLLAWCTGTVGAFGVTGFWIFRAARDYFHLSVLGAAGFTTAVTQVFVSLYFGLFGATVTLAAARRFRWLLVPTFFVAAEYGRAHLLSGCPWGLLGQSQLDPIMMQICDVTGVYGLSFLLALSATAVAEVRRTRVPIAIAASLILVVWLYGAWRLTTLAGPAGPSVQVALVQANLPNEERGRPEFFSTHLDRYLELTRRAAAPPPALIVWPENAVGFFPQENPPLLKSITEQLRAEHAALLAGAPRAGGSAGVAALYNSAYLFVPDGVSAVYDKRVLLPFVERAALRTEDGPYLAGDEPTIFDVAGRRFGALICYEAIYPELARELVERGAQFLVNISNDSWFEAGAGPEQHYEIARFRAVENRVSLVRVTNSGISGVIDPTGREIVRLPARVPVAQSASVPLGNASSFYSRHGDLFALACIAVTLGALTLRIMGHFGAFAPVSGDAARRPARRGRGLTDSARASALHRGSVWAGES
jgi:apolipoprotein N-acyltransferase